MKNIKSRIIIFIIGFFIFILPLYFISYNINREFEFYKERTEEDLKEKILQTTNKLEEDLEPFNYLNSEFDNIHSNLFPDYPKEILDGIPEDSFINTLYSEETLNKLVATIKDKYFPILVTLCNQDVRNTYAYCSPQLEKDLKNNSVFENEKSVFLSSKTYLDSILINLKYYYVFNKDPRNIIFEKLVKLNLPKRNYYTLCYKYISRFCVYNKNNRYYTDYYNKQILYSIVKTTLSSKGIHGFYTCLIPESHIDPELILESAIRKQNPNLLTKIELVDNQQKTEVTTTENGVEYVLKFPTSYISHVNAYKRLRGIDKTFIINNKLKIKADYPENLIFFDKINKITKFLAYIITLFYVLFYFKIINSHYYLNINLSNKLVIILSILLFLPISGSALLSLIISNKINEVVDLYLNKSLHNNLESLNLLDKENNLKRYSTIVEMKKIISEIDLYKQLKPKPYLGFFPKYKVPYWFCIFNTDLIIFPENGNGEIFYYNNIGERLYERGNSARFLELIKFLSMKYLKNMGLYKTRGDFNKDFFALTFIDKFINLKQEELIIGQESIPNRDFITLRDDEFPVLYYAIDKNKKSAYLYSSIINSNSNYDFLYYFTENNYKYFRPENKYGDINLGITFKRSYQGDNKNRYHSFLRNKEMHSLLTKALEYNDSGKEKIKIGNRSIIQEWLFNNDSPFVTFGMAEEKDFNFFKYLTSLILPVLLCYSIILLFLFSNFIGNFIKKPINILNKAIRQLEANNLGTTIEAFSNDEFNSITKGFNEMSVALKEKEQMKRYVSERLLQSVEGNNVQEAGKGKLEKVTILSSDIRNFTGISEKYEPSEIVEMLNSYFTKMQQAISMNGGIIDKYIGDAIQAVFYDEPNIENQVIRASKAAIAMRKALNELNIERQKNGLFTIENGIGIDTDFAITGTIGTSNGRKDFSVNGEVIERAANLEAKTKKTESKILISKKTVKELDCYASLARNDGLVYKEFDEESVELIDVRE